MEIKSQSSESNPGAVTIFPWVGRHIDKNGPIVFFHSEFKGMVVDSGVTNDGLICEVGKYSEAWTMTKFKEFKGTIKIVSK